MSSRSEFIHLYVKAPEGNGYTTPELMKRVDDHLVNKYPAMMKSNLSTGLPQQEADGTWEVRVLTPELKDMVRNILTGHYGLEVVREEKVGGQEDDLGSEKNL